MMRRSNAQQRKKSRQLTNNPLEFKEALSRLTVHGVPEICGTKSAKWKATWILVLLVAGASLTFEIVRTINNYLNSTIKYMKCTCASYYVVIHPVSTTYSVAPLNEIKFPKIYLCPLNVVDRRKIQNNFRKVYVERLNKFFGLGASLASNIEQFLFKINANYDITLFRVLKLMDEIEDLDMIDLLNMVSFDSEDFIRECSFERRSLNCANITTKVFDGNYGQCFLVDVNKVQQIPSFGLNIVLDIRRDIYDMDVLPTFDGVRLDILDDYGPIQSQSSVLLEPGGWTKITLQSRKYELLNCHSRVLYQPCEESTADWKYRNLNHEKYTRESCRFDCALNATLTNCDCLLPVNRKFYKPQDAARWKICDHIQMKDCFYDKLMSNKSSEELAECSKRCLNPCMYWKHDFGGVSRMGFNSIGLRDGTTCKTMNDTFERHCLNDIIILDIGYSDLIYTKITQTSSMTFDTFLSNVGGQVGLWMGVSVISIVQILALMLLYFKDKFVDVRNTV